MALQIQSSSVLVVDDIEMNRDMLCSLLAADGHKAAVAENGRLALEKIKSNPYDLILLDVMMPEMNGYQVLEHLKSDRALRDIPVIVLSALDEIGSVVRCIELGAEDYLPKPFDPVLLRARIGACLEKKRLRDQEIRLRSELEEWNKTPRASRAKTIGTTGTVGTIETVLLSTVGRVDRLRRHRGSAQDPPARDHGGFSRPARLYRLCRDLRARGSDGSSSRVSC